MVAPVTALHWGLGGFSGSGLVAPGPSWWAALVAWLLQWQGLIASMAWLLQLLGCAGCMVAPVAWLLQWLRCAGGCNSLAASVAWLLC